MDFRVGSPLEDAIRESSDVGGLKLILEGAGLKGDYVSLEIESWDLASDSLTSFPEGL